MSEAQQDELPVVYRRLGGVTYAVYGSSSLHYVEKLEAEIAELKRKLNTDEASQPTTVRKQLLMPAEMDYQLTELARKEGTTASEILRRALTLYLLAHEKKAEGLKMGFARQDQTLEVEIIGI